MSRKESKLVFKNNIKCIIPSYEFASIFLDKKKTSEVEKYSLHIKKGFIPAFQQPVKHKHIFILDDILSPPVFRNPFTVACNTRCFR